MSMKTLAFYGITVEYGLKKHPHLLIPNGLESFEPVQVEEISSAKLAKKSPIGARVGECNARARAIDGRSGGEASTELKCLIMSLQDLACGLGRRGHNKGDGAELEGDEGAVAEAHACK